MDVGYLICAVVWRCGSAPRFVRGKAHLHPASVWRTQFRPFVLPRSPSLSSTLRPPIHPHADERDDLGEISRLRRAHLPSILVTLSRPSLNSPPLPSRRPLSIPLFASSQQPSPALLLLSDYCAAVTAVCRSVCIRVIHFLGNISSCTA